MDADFEKQPSVSCLTLLADVSKDLLFTLALEGGLLSFDEWAFSVLSRRSDTNL